MTAGEFRRIALSLQGVSEAPHFERAAFRLRRIFASLSPDGLSANLKLRPEEQAFFVDMAPDAFSPVPNRWGARGWTRVLLASVGSEDLQAALTAAWKGDQA